MIVAIVDAKEDEDDDDEEEEDGSDSMGAAMAETRTGAGAGMCCVGMGTDKGTGTGTKSPCDAAAAIADDPVARRLDATELFVMRAFFWFGVTGRGCGGTDEADLADLEAVAVAAPAVPEAPGFRIIACACRVPRLRDASMEMSGTGGNGGTASFLGRWWVREI